jgi:hypothetical protein
MTNIIKKENNINFSWRIGSLILTKDELYLEGNPIWITSNRVAIQIPIGDILNVRAHKPISGYQDHLIVTYIDRENKDKEKIATFIHKLTWNLWVNGKLTRLEQNFFAPWVDAIEKLRGVITNGNQESDLVSQLKDLAQLKNEGILTEEEFSLEKERILHNRNNVIVNS